MIEDIKEHYENLFNNSKITVIVDGKETKEIRNVRYSLNIENNSFENLNEKAPLKEEIVERNFILEKSIFVFYRYLQDDLNSRRASFVNDYDEYDNHCISYLHFYCRNNTLYFNVYCRSMNFDTNFIFDNQTFILAYKEVFDCFKKEKIEIEFGSIDVHIMSLHKII